ncbi:hypothetical protein [Bradyrhizobium sp. USDA 4011]
MARDNPAGAPQDFQCKRGRGLARGHLFWPFAKSVYQAHQALLSKFRELMVAARSADDLARDCNRGLSKVTPFRPLAEAVYQPCQAEIVQFLKRSAFLATKFGYSDRPMATFRSPGVPAE